MNARQYVFRNAAALGTLLMLIVSPILSRAGIPLSREGQATASIAANGHVKQADILRRYLSKITGADFRVNSTNAFDSGECAIVLEVNETLRGISKRPTGKQGYRIHTDGSTLHLAGCSELGLTYAVYGLLEDYLGVHFYSEPFFVGDAFEVIPRQPTLTIDTIDDAQEPAFLSRSFFGHNAWMLKNRGLGAPLEHGQHNFYAYIPPKEYFSEHPEWFSLVKGKRKSTEHMGLCYLNEQLANEFARKVMIQLPKQDPAIPLPLCQGDGFTPCECEVCRKLVREEESEAAPIIVLLNRILERTAQKYPQHQLITFAYFETLKAPKTVRPHPNLWINIVSSAINQEQAGDQLGRIRGNSRNKDYQEAIETWTKLAPGRVMVWDWSANFFDATMEWPNFFNVCDNIRFYHEHGVSAVRLQMFAGDGNWGWLRRWVWTKLMWNPDADVAKLVQQFLRDYYGAKAAPILRAYLDYVFNVARESGYAASVCRGPGSPANVRKMLFTDEKVARMEALMAQAEQAAATENNPIYLAHVKHAHATSVDTLVLLGAGPLAKVADPRDGRLWLVPGGKPDMPARIDRIAEAVKGVRSGDDGNPWFYHSRFLATSGGPLTRIENAGLTVEVVANLQGRITSIIHQPTGEEILAAVQGVPAGYSDVVPVPAQEWSLEKVAQNRLDLVGELTPHTWHHHREEGVHLQLHRSVTLEGDAARVTVTRTYTGTQIHPKLPAMPAPTRFAGKWMLRVPKPDAAKISAAGGGLNQQLDVTQAATNLFQLTAHGGDVTINLDRGDGLVVVLTVPAKAIESVTLEPVPSEQRLTVTFTSLPCQMGREAQTINLPPQFLAVENKRTPIKNATTGGIGAGTVVQQQMSDDERTILRTQLIKLIGSVPARCPLNLRVISVVTNTQYTLKKVEYDTEPGLVVPAWLLVPLGAGPFPGVLAHHQHGGKFHIGKGEVVGTRKCGADQLYAHELAERGYVVLAPDSECFEERAGVALRNYEYNRFWSGVACGDLLRRRTLWDIIRAVDVLQSLPEVDAQRIGMIGHSLGGQETLWGAMFDERIKVAVSSCGFAEYIDVKGQFLQPNCHGAVPGILNCTKIGQMARLIAPRPFLMFSGDQDKLFLRSAVEPVANSLRQEYAARKMPERYVWHPFDGPHSFPEANRQLAYGWFDRWLKSGLANAVPTKPFDFSTVGQAQISFSRGVRIPTNPFAIDAHTLALWHPAEADQGGLIPTKGSCIFDMRLKKTDMITCVPGKFGQALHFPNGSFAEGIPRQALSKPTASFSVEAWIRTTATGHGQPIVAQWSYLPDWRRGGAWWVGLTPDGRAGIGMPGEGTSPTGVESALIAGHTRINDGQWHYVLAACDEAFWHLFVDGRLEGVAQNNTVSGTFDTQVTLAASTFGNRPDQVRYFEGDIEEIRLSDIDRSLAGMTVETGWITAVLKNREVARQKLWHAAGITNFPSAQASPSETAQIADVPAERMTLTMGQLQVRTTLLFPVESHPKGVVIFHPRSVIEADNEILGTSPNKGGAAFGWGPRLAKAGFIVAVPSLPNAPYYSGISAALLRGVPPARDLLLIQRALVDVLTARPDCRGMKIAAIGLGLGGWQSALITALDQRVTAGAAIYGLTTVAELNNSAAFPPAPVFLPNLAKLGDMGAVLALVAPRPFLVIAARGDWQYPVAGAVQAVNVARQVAPASRITFEVDEGLVPLLDIGALRNRELGHNALYAQDWNPRPPEPRIEQLIHWLLLISKGTAP